MRTNILESGGDLHASLAEVATVSDFPGSEKLPISATPNRAIGGNIRGGMFVVSNLATSLDGKIALPSRGHHPLGTPLDRRTMRVIRAEADAILMGSGSLRAYPKPLLGSRGACNVIVSTRLAGISPRWAFFREPSIRRILMVGPRTPEARIRRFSKVADVIRLPELDSKSAGAASAARAGRAILRECRKQGIRRLLVEGGGEILWLFAAGNLIDRYHVTLAPKIVGGRDAPTLVEGAGFAPGHLLRLRLKRAKKIGDELYLIYERR